MNINQDILDLISYGIVKEMIQNEDIEYVYNKLTDILKVEKNNDIKIDNKDLNQLSIILNPLLDYSYNVGLFTPNSIKQRDLFESYVMDVFSPLPSCINRTFNHYLSKNPIDATNYYYNLSVNNNYIKSNRISKNIEWKSNTKYGKLQLSVNLSKPEKDPRDITAEVNNKKTKYPMCLLCKENVGFYGNNLQAGRSNHRIIKIDLNDEEFYFQYSPYVYYNEHSIVLSKNHSPMNVSDKTFKRLFDFVDIFPHYFLGSNAGLPIVGGSILSHEHYQGGRHHFPIEDAKEVFVDNVANVSIKYLIWPMSVIRLESKNKDEIIKTATKLFNYWENYSNKHSNIVAYTNAVHNAVTPIARKNADVYVLDMTLRNNLTSSIYPDGIFHTHPEHHNIKKENIGLIEVMGLAVLPPRLEKELKAVKNCLINGSLLPQEYSIHSEWLVELKDRYQGNDIDEFINNQIGNKFMRSLENSGVFKQTENGIEQFTNFITTFIQKYKE